MAAVCVKFPSKLSSTNEEFSCSGWIEWLSLMFISNNIRKFESKTKIESTSQNIFFGKSNDDRKHRYYRYVFCNVVFFRLTLTTTMFRTIRNQKKKTTKKKTVTLNQIWQCSKTTTRPKKKTEKQRMNKWKTKNKNCVKYTHSLVRTHTYETP